MNTARRLRGSVLAALSALLTVVGHTAAGGGVPDLAVLAVLVPLVAGVFVTLAERCRGFTGTLVTLAAGQFALHHLMVLLHPHRVVEPALLPESGMLVVHAAATLVTAVALRHADHGLAALTAALCRVLPRRPFSLPADRALPAFASASPSVAARLARAFAVAHARRGPPVGC